MSPTTLGYSCTWPANHLLKITHVPNSKYAVYVYILEDNNPETFRIILQGKVVEKDYYSGQEGQWRRLGPWMTNVADGVISITSSGGAANFCGIEIWQEVKP